MADKINVQQSHIIGSLGGTETYRLPSGNAIIRRAVQSADEFLTTRPAYPSRDALFI